MEKSTKLDWNNIDVYQIQDILRDLNFYYLNICNLHLDYENKITYIDLSTDNKNILKDSITILIPNLLILINKKLQYGSTINFDINSFPSVLNFIKLYAPHIEEFIIDQNITEVQISAIHVFNYNSSNAAESSHNFEKINKKIELLNNNSKIAPLILIELIRKFYTGKDSKLYLNPLNFSNHKHMSNIFSDNLLINNLINEPSSVFKSYKFSQYNDCISYSSHTELYKFMFADIEYFSTSNIEPYKNFMELQLLDYIAQR